MNSIATWLGGLIGADRDHQTRNVGMVEAYPSQTRIVLADGQIVNVRNASLAAAKDLLAAQRAVERRMQAEWLGRVVAAEISAR